MVQLFCDRCGEEWEYTGDRPPGTFVECPQCEYDVRITEKDQP